MKYKLIRAKTRQYKACRDDTRRRNIRLCKIRQAKDNIHRYKTILYNIIQAMTILEDNSRQEHIRQDKTS